MASIRDPSKTLLFGTLLLLAVAVAQVAWWIADQVRLAHGDRDHMAALYRAEASAANAIAGLLRERCQRLDAGASSANGSAAGVLDELRSHLPHLATDGDGHAMVRAEALQSLAAASASRINRYAWEGGFFLLVLLGGMIVLVRVIRHDVKLRRRQQTFLAAVSHEFKSPLASMRLSAETLALRAADGDSRRLGQRMLEDGDRLLNMVDNLLDTTRIEEGELELAPEAVPLASAVQSACGRISEEARAHDIAIDSDVDDDLRILGDRAAVDAVLRNLLDNALKACLAGGGKRIALGATRRGEGVAITVADDGIGFPPHDARAIFGKFHRAHQSRMPGTGLGLYIVQRLAALSNASVEAASAGAGRGALFTLHWPAAK